MKFFILILFFFVFNIQKSYSYFPINSIDNNYKVIPSLYPMLEKVLPSVVSIYTKGVKINKLYIPKEFKNFFEYNIPEYNKKYFEGLGSGVIIDSKNKYIITNNHVINNAKKIKIKLNNGQIFDAKLIGNDEQTDIALLQIISKNNIKLIEIKLSNSDNAKVGDFVVAIGNPFGLGQTVTSGIISAVGRSGLNIINGLENFIQTDASINKGNSGGALVNIYGELVGINTAILAPNGGNIGIGFAIPSNIVNILSKQLIKYGEIKRGFLGIKGIELNNEISKIFKIKVKNGVFVSEVITKSPAYKFGIKPGDVITYIDEKKVENFLDLKTIINTISPDKLIKIRLIRNNELKIISLKLENISKKIIGEKISFPILSGAIFMNNSLEDGTKIVEVVNVLKNSQAYLIGLKSGDLIIKVNDNRIHNIKQFKEEMNKKQSTIVLHILRNNSNIFILIK